MRTDGTEAVYHAAESESRMIQLICILTVGINMA